MPAFAQPVSFSDLLQSKNFFHHGANLSRLDQSTDLLKFTSAGLHPRHRQSFSTEQSARNAKHHSTDCRRKKPGLAACLFWNRRSEGNQPTPHFQRPK